MADSRRCFCRTLTLSIVWNRTTIQLSTSLCALIGWDVLRSSVRTPATTKNAYLYDVFYGATYPHHVRKHFMKNSVHKIASNWHRSRINHEPCWFVFWSLLPNIHHNRSKLNQFVVWSSSGWHTLEIYNIHSILLEYTQYIINTVILCSTLLTSARSEWTNSVV